MVKHRNVDYSEERGSDKKVKERNEHGPFKVYSERERKIER